MIFRIQLKNWASHCDTELYFKKGLNLIFGENGSGKSSILHAIQFAITGKPPFKYGKIRDFVTKGTKNGYISLGFSSPNVDQEQYRVDWKISSKGGLECTLQNILDGTIKKEKGREVQKIVGDILTILEIKQDFPEDLLYIREGEVAQYIQTNAGGRRKLFAQLINIQRIQEIARIAKSISREKTKEAEIINERRHNLIFRVESLKNETIGDLIQKKERIIHDIQEISIITRGFTKESNNQKIIEIEHQLKNKNEELNTIKERINLGQKRLDQYYRDFGSYKEYLNSSDIIKDLEVKRVEIEKSLEIQVNRRQEIELYRDFLSKQRALLLNPQYNQDLCPTCRKPLQFQEKQILLQDYSSEVLKKENEIESIIEEIKLYSKSLSEIRNEIEKTMKAINAVPFIKELIEDIKKWNYQIQIIHEDIKKVEDQQASIDLVEGSPLKDYELQIKKLNSLELELRNCDDAISRVKQKENELNFINSEITQGSQQVLKYSNQINILDYLVKACELTSKNFLSVLFENLKGKIEEKLHQFFPLEGVDFDQTYFTPKFNIQGHYLPFSHLSGGEKLLAFLTLRFSLLEIYSQSDFILFDEPSERLDMYHCRLLRNHFEKMFNNPFFSLKQALIAANDSRFSGPLSPEFDFQWNAVFNITKVEGKSVVKIISKQPKTKPLEEIIKDFESLGSGSIEILPEESEKVVNFNQLTQFSFLKYLDGIHLEYLLAPPTKNYDFVVFIKQKKIAIQVKSLAINIESFQTSAQNIRDLETVEKAGFDGLIIAIYFRIEKIWKLIRLHTEKALKSHISLNSIQLEPLESLLT